MLFRSVVAFGGHSVLASIAKEGDYFGCGIAEGRVVTLESTTVSAWHSAIGQRVIHDNVRELLKFREGQAREEQRKRNQALLPGGKGDGR